MQIFQLPHPKNEVVLCDHLCDLTADFLEVMDSKTVEVIAKLTPTNPEFHWQGDTLLYVEKSTIRVWQGGTTAATVGRLGDKTVPRFPEDNWEWSGDGTHFTLTRYDQREVVPDPDQPHERSEHEHRDESDAAHVQARSLRGPRAP